MEKCIEGAKKLIDEQIDNHKMLNTSFISSHTGFDGYKRGYFWTNENIKEYLDLADFEGKENALTVMSSGDHIFNLIAKGIKNIDTFDINKLTEFLVLGLKKAMILKYNYHEFILTMKLITDESLVKSVEGVSQIIYDLLPYMDRKYRLFWQEILDYNYKIQKELNMDLNLIYLLYCGLNNTMAFINRNQYLHSEEEYNKFKNNLYKTNISFKYANAIDLDKEFNDKYDFILLSNILDYAYIYFGELWDYGKLTDFENQIQKLTKKDCVVFLHYIFNSYKKYNPIIHNSLIFKNNLNGEQIWKISKYFSKEIPLFEEVLVRKF